MKLYKTILDNKSYECITVNLVDEDNDGCKEILFGLFGTCCVGFPKIENKLLFEVRALSCQTPWSSNVMKILKKSGLGDIVNGVTKSFLYLVDTIEGGIEIFNEKHDRLTETYEKDIACKEEDIWRDACSVETLNEKYGLSFDKKDIENAKNVLNRVGKCNDKLFVLMDLAQSNSEHCRHHFFNGEIKDLGGSSSNETLFQLVKEPLKRKISSTNNIIAFADNSSAISGYKTNDICVDWNTKEYCEQECVKNFVLTAETHNFPTGVAPFQGAATGIGGRIRDVQATGTGAVPVCSSAGYCVGDIDGYDSDYPTNLAKPMDILIEASNGASDYGNKFGEPIILGFTRSFRSSQDRTEWIKPIMFTAGLGFVRDEHVKKEEPEKDMLICKIGGPAYKVGLGGGAASSRISDEKNSELDFSAVQRDDAEMEQKMNRVVRTCVELGDRNPIVSIHDQGAGGNGNVLKEIVDGRGAVIDIGKITLGDKSMKDVEIWVSEYQESNAILIKYNDLKLMRAICEREDTQLDVVGRVTGDGKLDIVNGEREIVTDYALDESCERKKYVVNTECERKYDFDRSSRFGGADCSNIRSYLTDVFNLIDVGSKRFLTNKVDRSVTGLIAQQQCVGPFHTPLSNFGLMSSGFVKNEYGKYTGCATSVGEQPIVGLFSSKIMVMKTIGEMLTNMMFVVIDDFENISCSANWMWACPNKDPEEGGKMYTAMKELSNACCELGIVIDGGKDSLSMATNVNKDSLSMATNVNKDSLSMATNVNKDSLSMATNVNKDSLSMATNVNKDSLSMATNVNKDSLSMATNVSGVPDTEVVKSPGSLVLSGYAKCPDIYKKVTPNLKMSGSSLYFVDLSRGYNGLGGSCFSRIYSTDCGEPPNVTLDCLKDLKKAFKVTQKLIQQGKVLAGHDRSDGGLITTLAEMAISSGIGVEISVNEHDLVKYLFNESLGFVLESYDNDIVKYFAEVGINSYKIGKCTGGHNFKIINFGREVLDMELSELRYHWEEMSMGLEHKQCNPECVEQEAESMAIFKYPPMFHGSYHIYKPSDRVVGIVREEGSNSDREIASAFYLGGAKKVIDINTNDLIDNDALLDGVDLLVFVGGFSFADVLGSAKGWEMVIKMNKSVREQFQRFYDREDTMSLGICNGCQLMVRLGWLGEGITMEENLSGRFESRFPIVKVNGKLCKILEKNDGDVCGIWTAHHQGRFEMSEDRFKELYDNNQIVMQYVDNKESATEMYPMNPNGSIGGVAGICSENGRHIAMMPHPERSYLKWQFPYVNCVMGDNTPWFKMFY